MASLSQLEAELRQFDGTNTDSLVPVAEKLSSDPSSIDQLICFAEQADPPLQTAATWLLKHFQSSHIEFTPSQVTKLIDIIGRAGSWESRLHLLQMLPDLAIPADSSNELFQTLLLARSEPNKFIRAWAYSGLHALASQLRQYLPYVVPILDQASIDEAPSVRARIRQLDPLVLDPVSIESATSSNLRL